MPLDIRTPSDPAFKTLVWGRVFNRRPRHQALHDSPPREPAAIALPRSRADVVDAVLEARARGWRIAVRSGGHSWAAWGVRAGTLLIDLRGLSVRPLTADPLQWGRESIEPLQSPDARPVAEDIAYDAASGVVSCGPAVSSGELNAALEAHGRFFAGGHHPDVGLGGFILQGGMGWNARGWGWACEQLVGVDVVTADGKVVEAREGDEEGDRWLWLARGAGPGFPGVVTRLHLRTRRKTELWQSMYFLELEKTEDVLERVIKFSATAASDIEIVCVGLSADDPSRLDPLPGRVVVNVLAFNDSETAARAALEAFDKGINDLVPFFSEVCVSTLLRDQYRLQRLSNPEGFRYYCDNVYLREDFGRGDSSAAAAGEGVDTPRAIARLLSPAFTSAPTDRSSALYFSMAPGPSSSTRRTARAPMALSMETDHFVSLYAAWPDDDKMPGMLDETCPAWVDRSVESWLAAGAVQGSYLGDADFRARKAGRYWGREEARRLARERRALDLEGRICGYLNGGAERDDEVGGRVEEYGDGEEW